jgi:DNA-binding XRE family transcriptional regulator
MTELRQRIQRRKPNTRLYGLRINAGLSRQALGYRIGISAETIRIAELGFVPGPRIQFALAREFELEPLDIWPLETQKVLV